MQRASSTWRSVGGVFRFVLIVVVVSLVGASVAVADPADPVPELVEDINVVSADAGSTPDYLTSVGSFAVFVADDGVHGRELWRSDGTAAGTQLVADINPGPDSSDPYPRADTRLSYSQSASVPVRFTVIDGIVYFVADDGTHGYELWRTDGTEAGTTLVADINPGAEASEPFSLTDVDGTLYLIAGDGVHGWEPWTSDGTEAGTTLLKDIRPEGTWGGWGPPWGGSSTLFYGFGNGAEFTKLGGFVYFGADDGVHGRELWRTDGTEAGTTLFKDIRPGSTGSSGTILVGEGNSVNDVFHLTRVGDRIVFAADNGVHGKELWKTQGSAANTTLLYDIDASGSGLAFKSGLSTPLASAQFIEIDGTVLFTARSGSYQLWRTDGTVAGTSSLGPTGLLGRELTDVDGTLYFRGSGEGEGVEPWVSDGTLWGTRLLAEINTPPPNTTGSHSSNPRSFNSVGGGMAVFVADSPSVGRELWLSDGTTAGTRMISEIAPGTADAFGWAQEFATVGDRLLFPADDALHGDELWSIQRFPDPPPAENPPPDDTPPADEDPPTDDDPAGSLDGPKGETESGGAAGPAAAPSAGRQSVAPANSRVVVRGRGVVRGRTLRLTVHCRGASACKGVELAVRTKSNTARSRGVLLTKRRVRVAANTEAKISLRLTRKDRRMLAKSQAVRVSGSGIATTTVRLAILR